MLFLFLATQENTQFSKTEQNGVWTNQKAVFGTLANQVLELQSSRLDLGNDVWTSQIAAFGTLANHILRLRSLSKNVAKYITLD